MELNIGKNIYEGQWFDFGDGKLKIRAYPASKSSFAWKDGAIVFSGDLNFEKFRYCLIEWEGFVARGDKDKKPLALTDEIKRKIFDFNIGSVLIDGKEISMAAFVISRADEMMGAAEAAEKN